MSDPPQGAQGSTSERATLSRELSNFLIEFSIALNKHAMYPGGHPSLQPAAGRVLNRIEPLLGGKSTLSIGVARQQLIIEGVATDPKNPVLKELASRLHRHHLGAVSFRRGLDRDELHEVFQLLAQEADLTGQPLGLGAPEQLAAWPHAQLYPLTYERLELIAEDEQGEGSDEKRTRGAQLWVGLARAAMAETETETDGNAEADPAVVADAIRDHPQTAAYAQVIVGYMLQIAEEVRAAGGQEALELKERMSKLVGNLDPQTLERLLEMGGDRPQRREFLLNAAQGMAADAVVDLVHAAHRTEERQEVSSSLMRMLQKLAHHAESGSGRRQRDADSSLREQVTELIEGWSYKDPNPQTYGGALTEMARARSVYSVSPEQRFAPEPKRMVQMSLEAEAMGEAVTHAADRLAEEGDLKWLLTTLQEVDSSNVTQGVWQHVATPEMVGAVAHSEPLDADALDLLLPRVGIGGADPMLDSLAESDSSQTRRSLLERIIRLGSEVGPLALARLDDERPHVQRNMLTIIAELPEPPRGFNATGYAKHSDGRVRREAVRIMMKDPTSRERAICQALADTEPKIVRVGITGAQVNCPETAVSLLVSRVEKPGDEELRLLAIRALGRTHHPLALRTLLAIAAPRRFLFWTKLPPRTPEYLAALAALQGHPDDPQVQRALAAAAKSRDVEIAAAAAGRKGT
jgi:hypothetical protein